MKSRHIRRTKNSGDLSYQPIWDVRSDRGDSIFIDSLGSINAADAFISDRVFGELIKQALRRVENTRLNTTMTTLLGLSTVDEVILTKQIGYRAGEDLHALIVSIRPGTDDIILVNQTSRMMDIYLTDRTRQLRLAAMLQRDSDKARLVSTEQAYFRFALELSSWAILAEAARL